MPSTRRCEVRRNHYISFARRRHLTALLAPGLLFMFATSRATECVDYLDFAHWAGSYPVPYGSAYDVLIQDNLAYVAHAGVEILDISQPDAPLRLSYLFVGWVNDICLADTLLFASGYDGDDGVFIISVKNPNRPVRLGTCPISDNALGVAAASGFAYVACERSGLTVIDVSNPLSPTVAATIDTPGKALSVSLMGSFVLVSDNDNGVQVIDVQDPYSPRIVAEYRTPDSAQSTFVQGSLAYIACGYGGMQIVDFGDPVSPVLVGSIDSDYYAIRVFVKDHRAFLADSLGGLRFHDHGVQMYDVENPALPVKLGTLLPIQDENALAVADDIVFVATDAAGLQIFDVSNPLSLPRIGVYDPFGDTDRIWAFDDLVFEASRENDYGMEILDVSGQGDPQYLGTIATTGSLRFLVRRGPFVMLGVNEIHESALKVFDISNPASPRRVTTLRMPDRRLGGFDVRDNTLCVQDGAGFYVYDIALIGAPRLLGTTNDILSTGNGLIISGDYVFVASSGLQVMDISDPTRPTRAASVEDTGVPSHLIMAGNMVYLACGFAGVYAIDVSQPLAPTIINHLVFSERVLRVAYDSSFLYLSTLGESLKVVDVSNPFEPSLVGTIGPPGNRDSSVAGNSVYIATGYIDGLQVFPAQCPGNSIINVVVSITPREAGNRINCLAHGDRIIPTAILSSPDFDATSIDHSTVRFGPDQAAEVHANRWGPIRHETDVDGDGRTDLLFHFRFKDSGIQCNDTLAELTGFTFDGLPVAGYDSIQTEPVNDKVRDESNAISIFPNPFNPKTDLSFTLLQSQQGMVAVYDVKGRRISVIADGILKGGMNLLSWNGKDSKGITQPAGTYFIRILTDEFQVTRKVLLLR